MFVEVLWSGSQELDDREENIQSVSNSQLVDNQDWIFECFLFFRNSFAFIWRNEAKHYHTGEQKCKVEDGVPTHELQPAEWLF